MADPARASLNTATVQKQWRLPECIEGCARAGIGGISPWRDVLSEMGVARAARQIRDAGLTVSGLCRGGMFTWATAADHQAMIDDNLRAIEEAVAIKAAALVLVVGGLPGASRDLAGARDQVRDAISELLPHARSAGMPLAIEPLHPMYAADRACINTLGQALDLCDQLGPGLGVAVDVYHVWWDPDLRTQIERAGASERLFAFHLCDWLVPTRDLLLDRGMMGDGVIDLTLIHEWMTRSGYAGALEVEIFSEANWWQRDPDEVLSTIQERIATVV